ncbi:MAG: adenosylcobinamide kinase / adenosylcobinamide-phosphate guanylyltransferase [Chloroflexota bacterium]|jgi:adenosyl cobinamide kinase/adenosyl cobinamide phosphate guanylyltransferase|nr:adenosylcobinamide kinase / adenosylcobinamide-phosphate guanylyltransferase [Chloroflexota bacterium]
MGYTFLVGGARSGKSRLAVRLAMASGRMVTFLATAEAGDAEMRERIRRHFAERPPYWLTIEAPLDLANAVDRVPDDAFAIVDCLTLWVSNLLGADPAVDISGMAAAVIDRLVKRPSGSVVVSNEVGSGIVPANELARSYRDVLGSVNSMFAASADQAALVVAGRPLMLSTAAELVQPK